jgi:hypothetical protein
MQIILIVRCKDEPFIHEFVEYYMNEGVDRILIYDDNSKKEAYDKINDKFLPHVEIMKSEASCSTLEKLNDQFNNCYEKIQNYDWVIYVDADEYITSKDGKNIRTHLETTFAGFDYIKIPWVMMARNKRVKNPKSLLQDVIHRWNHDIKHIPKIKSTTSKFRSMYNAILTKAIFNPKKFKKLQPHGPIPPTDLESVKAVDSVHLKPFEMIPGHKFYNAFREHHISSAILLCYHYRFCSEEHVYYKHENTVHNFENIKACLNYDYPDLIDTTLRDKSISNSKKLLK